VAFKWFSWNPRRISRADYYFYYFTTLLYCKWTIFAILLSHQSEESLNKVSTLPPSKEVSCVHFFRLINSLNVCFIYIHKMEHFTSAGKKIALCYFREKIFRKQCLFLYLIGINKNNKIFKKNPERTLFECDTLSCIIRDEYFVGR